MNINTIGYEVDEMKLMACALQKSTYYKEMVSRYKAIVSCFLSRSVRIFLRSLGCAFGEYGE